MASTLREKLSWRAAGRPEAAIAEDRASMARSFIYLYGLGGTLVALTALLLPHADDLNRGGMLTITAITYIAVACFLIWFDRLPLWVFQLAPAFGSMLITMVLVWGGVNAISAYAMFYFWVTISVTYFFGLKLALGTMTFAGALYAIVLAAADDVALPVLHWVMAMGTMFVAGVLMVILRQHAEEATLEADRSQANFFAQVSHELRTPLTSIVGYLDLLKEAPDTPAERRNEAIGVIDRNSRRLLRLVGDLLFVAQADSGVSIEQAEFSLSDVARQGIETFARRAEREGLDLVGEIEEVPPGQGDRSRIAQALDNLISNSIKFTPQGGTVTVRVRSDGPAHAILEVSDTGIGIPAIDRERVFERFYRTEEARSKSIEGTGLGLGIVRAIVDLHGGEITVDGAKGEGATFTIRLPSRPPE